MDRLELNEFKELLQCLHLTPVHYDQIAALFACIANDAVMKNFHPHPFTEDYANKIVNYNSLDSYLGAFADQHLVGYGMLRGWDAGYKIPSLGIYLAPVARGRGLSSKFMEALHAEASQKGAISVRLKVYPENTIAISLYKRMGYVFTSEEDGQLVGFVDL